MAFDPQLYSAKTYDYLKLIDFEYESQNIINSFPPIYREMRKLFDCKIKYKLHFTDCEIVMKPMFGIYTYDVSPTQSLLNFLKIKHKLRNESIFENSKIFNTITLFIEYSRLKTNLESNNNKFENSNDRSYWTQTPIFQISSNLKEFSQNLFSFTTLGNFLKIFNNYVILNYNQNYTLTKKSFQMLGFPYQSKCSYYDSNQTIFDSVSHDHCVRQCLRYYCEIKMNCSCFLLKFKRKYYQKLFIQSDVVFNSFDICLKDRNLMISFYENYTKFCNNLCPIDCISEEYFISYKEELGFARNNSKFWKLSVFWDNTKPIIMNKETPVMTFTNYFCYIGGLFGMWFGISANQFLRKLKENFSKYYHNFINYSLILYYISLEIILIIKTKFLSIIRYY